MRSLLISSFVVLVAGLLGLSVHAFQGSGRIVCGTNDSNDIYCTTYEGLEHGKWEQLPGHLKQVIVRDQHLWGVNAQGDIYYAADIRNPQWIQLQGHATEVTEGHGVLCVVNERSAVYCADKGITTPTPQWRMAPDNSRLKFVSVN
jgi:Tectonin domain